MADDTEQNVHNAQQECHSDHSELREPAHHSETKKGQNMVYLSVDQKRLYGGGGVTLLRLRGPFFFAAATA